jgi:hypothetical protein
LSGFVLVIGGSGMPNEKRHLRPNNALESGRPEAGAAQRER